MMMVFVLTAFNLSSVAKFTKTSKCIMHWHPFLSLIFQVPAFLSAITKILYVFIVSCNEVYCILLQVNGLEKKSIPLPRHHLDKLTHDDALEMALSQTDLQKYMSGYRIINTAFTLHPSYEAVINIKTERISKAKQQQMQEG
jgi:hypothetical protein